MTWESFVQRLDNSHISFVSRDFETKGLFEEFADAHTFRLHEKLDVGQVSRLEF